MGFFVTRNNITTTYQQRLRMTGDIAILFRTMQHLSEFDIAFNFFTKSQAFNVALHLIQCINIQKISEVVTGFFVLQGRRGEKGDQVSDCF